MKALKPSHRENKRYLLLSGKDISFKIIEGVILKFVGILGYAKTSPIFIKNIGKKIIISINRKELDKVKASILMSGKDIKIEKISGAIGKLK